MRDIAIIIVTAIVFAALLYGQGLQDQMCRKGYRPGDSMFSMIAAFRSLLTVDALKFAILGLVLLIFIEVFAALDKLEFFSR
jgi:hypothetical protein